MPRNRWPLLAAFVCAAAYADPPPATPQPQRPVQAKPQPAPHGAPDDGLIEFLGSDDVGDAAWWEFLQRAPPRGNVPPAPPVVQGVNK